MCNKTDKPLARLTTNKREDNLLRSGKKQEICSRPYRHQKESKGIRWTPQKWIWQCTQNKPHFFKDVVPYFWTSKKNKMSVLIKTMVTKVWRTLLICMLILNYSSEILFKSQVVDSHIQENRIDLLLLHRGFLSSRCSWICWTLYIHTHTHTQTYTHIYTQGHMALKMQRRESS